MHLNILIGDVIVLICAVMGLSSGRIYRFVKEIQEQSLRHILISVVFPLIIHSKIMIIPDPYNRDALPQLSIFSIIPLSLVKYLSLLLGFPLNPVIPHGFPIPPLFKPSV